MNQNNNNAPNFKEVGGSSDNQRWEPKAEEKNGYRFDPNGHNTLMGYYKDVRILQRPGGSGTFTVHEIQVLNTDGSLGECVDISGDTVLNDRLGKIELGTYVKLQYMGRKHKPGVDTNNHWNQTNSYHIWSVGAADNMARLHEITGGQQRNKPVDNSQQNNGGQQQQNHQNNGSGYNPNQQQGNGAPVFNQTNGQQNNGGGYNPNQQNNGGQQQGGYKPPMNNGSGQGTYTPGQQNGGFGQGMGN